jgi:hypothetical protein
MDAIARSKGILGSTRELLVPATAIGAGRYSEGFLKAIDHALAFAEKDRPATIDLWRKELVGTKAAAMSPRVPVPSARSAPAPTLPLSPAKPPVARTVALIAVVAAVAVIGGGIGAYMTTSQIQRTQSKAEGSAGEGSARRSRARPAGESSACGNRAP